MSLVGLVVAGLTLFVVTMYFPIAAFQVYVFAIKWRRRREVHECVPPAPGRRLLTAVVTNGQNPWVVERILAETRAYRVPMRYVAVVEEADAFPYSAERVAVPASFRPPNGSRRKMRALHWFSLWLAREGLGEETYVVHLDDDSVASASYYRHVLGMPEEAGQGVLHLREHGRHMMSTLADFVRVSDCETMCYWWNGRGKPKAVHGEGLVIRADVEAEIGWDYGTFGGEDFLMGQNIAARYYRFGFIPHATRVAPPLSTVDFLKQRRRWIWSTLTCWRQVAALDRFACFWVLYRYAVGWTGFMGFSLLVLNPLLWGVPTPLPVFCVGAFNLSVYFASYQYGAMKTARRYMARAFALQLAVSAYEGMSLPYSILFPPDRNGFDVIRKV